MGRHAVWAAAEGAALALCEKENGYTASQLWDPRFLVVAIVCVVCHTLLNVKVPMIDGVVVFGIPIIKFLLATIVIWIVVAVLINRGLAQVNRMISGEEPYDLVPESETAAVGTEEEPAPLETMPEIIADVTSVPDLVPEALVEAIDAASDAADEAPVSE